MRETYADLPPGVLASWVPGEASGRGRRPSIQVGDVVSAAMAVADAEGLAGVSMPRVAQRIGVTQNALYRHVASKEELVALIADAATGTPPDLPDEADWRSAARAWVTAVVDRYLAHPWLLDLRLRAPATRNTVLWTEAFLRATRVTGLPVGARVQFALLLEGYARYTAELRRDLADQQPLRSQALVAALAPLLERDGCTEFAAFLAQTGPVPGADAEDAAFGLERILDGIEVFITRQATAGGTGPPSRPR
jgi:AcrR family transcriptional regulator